MADDAWSVWSTWLRYLAGPISRTRIQYMDFVEMFNVSLDLATIYFAHFNEH